MANIRALAYHNLSLMLEAGLPTIKALETAVSGLRGKMPRVFSALAEDVAAGKPLAESMAKHKNTFPRLDVRIVEAAEISGNLPESFEMLSQWHAFCHRIGNIILSGMALPVLVLNIAAFVFPLPDLVLGKISFLEFAVAAAQTLAVIYVPAAAIGAIILFAPKTGPLRMLLDAVTLKIPVLGQAILRLALSRYCHVFHMLYKAGIPILQTAERAANLTGNAVIARRLKGGVQSAAAGNTVVDGFSKSLPADFLAPWRVGEEAGSLDDISRRLAENNAESAELFLTELARWLPRLVYALICLLIILRIFQLLPMLLSTYQL